MLLVPDQRLLENVPESFPDNVSESNQKYPGCCETTQPFYRFDIMTLMTIAVYWFSATLQKQ
jgi:hypothetical protein